MLVERKAKVHNIRLAKSIKLGTVTAHWNFHGENDGGLTTLAASLMKVASKGICASKPAHKFGEK